MLARLSRWCYRHRRAVVAIWVVALVALSVVGGKVGQLSKSFDAGNTESSKAFNLLKTRFPQAAGDSGQIVVRAPGGVDQPAVQAQLQALVTRVKAVPGVAAVAPFGALPGTVSADKTITFTQVQFAARGFIDAATKNGVLDAVKAARTPQLQVEAGGQQFGEQRPSSSEGIGILAAVVILLVAFGSVLAMGLPIVMALFGIGIGLALVQILTRVLTVPDFATQVASMIGIGVGIDYALFIVTRYRHGLQHGQEPEEAVVSAISTAGKAVLFAGCTVVISLLGLLLIGLSFIRGLGLGASAVVLVSMAASVTLLPALLGFVGRTIDRLSIPGFAARQLKAEGGGFWFRWSRTVGKRPWPFAVGGFVLLLVLALPVLDLHLGGFDAGSDPKGTTTRSAYDLLTEGFGPGFSGPLLVAAELPHGQADLPKVQAIAKSLEAQHGVVKVIGPIPAPSGDAAILQVFPSTGPSDLKTQSLLHHLRNVIRPEAERAGLKVYVGGSTAAFADLSALLGARLPVFIGAVLVFSFLLLLAVFRSILVPLKAVLMNLLSIGAAYGVLVAVFQKGWGASLLGVHTKGPLIAFAPMMLFAILFGLSMDYEVFLLSRVKEEFDRTGDNTTAVADGLATTARVITAAALIMVSVFGSFILGDAVVIKEFGLGLSAAILLDATIVRLILVPATMELLGEANWWFPRWLEPVVPKIHIEGTPQPEPVV